MLLHRAAQGAGALAVNDGDGLDAEQGAAVDELVDHHDRFLDGLPAQVKLAARAALGLVHQSLGHAAVFLLLHAAELAAALFIHQPQAADRDLCLDDSRLHLHVAGAVRVREQHALLSQLGDQHQIPLLERPRRDIFFLCPSADNRVSDILQAVDVRFVGGFCALYQLGKFLALLLAAQLIQLVQQLLRFRLGRGDDSIRLVLRVLQLSIHQFIGFLLVLFEVALGFNLF